MGPYSPNECTPAWQNEPPIANARRNPATVAVGSNLYAITGFNAAPDYTAVNERFNGTSWTTLAPIPVPHAQSRGTAVGTNIYVPGGFNSVSFGGPLNTMQIYNTTANTWSAGMTMPAARSRRGDGSFQRPGVRDRRLHILSGTGHNEVYIYNPGTNSYTTGAPMTATQGNVGRCVVQWRNLRGRRRDCAGRAIRLQPDYQHVADYRRTANNGRDMPER